MVVLGKGMLPVKYCGCVRQGHAPCKILWLWVSKGMLPVNTVIVLGKGMLPVKYCGCVRQGNAPCKILWLC